MVNIISNPLWPPAVRRGEVPESGGPQTLKVRRRNYNYNIIKSNKILSRLRLIERRKKLLLANQSVSLDHGDGVT